MSRPRDDRLPSFRKCNHPGCENRMWRGSSTYDAGLCSKHGGHKRGKAVVQFVPLPPRVADRPDIRTVGVVKPSYSGSSSDCGVMTVSLSREPWMNSGDNSGGNPADRYVGSKPLHPIQKTVELTGRESASNTAPGPNHGDLSRGDRTNG